LLGKRFLLYSMASPEVVMLFPELVSPMNVESCHQESIICMLGRLPIVVTALCGVNILSRSDHPPQMARERQSSRNKERD